MRAPRRKRIAFSPTEPVRKLLDELRESGLHGTTVADVVERLVSKQLRDMLGGRKVKSPRRAAA